MRHSASPGEEAHARLLTNAWLLALLISVAALGIAFMFGLRFLSQGHVGATITMLVLTVAGAAMCGACAANYTRWGTRLARVRFDIATHPSPPPGEYRGGRHSAPSGRHAL
jgi:hypothetical protein